jgi:hypothetical protein
MNKLHLLLTALFMVLLSISCKKKNDSSPAPVPATTNYQPVTSGSTWTYSSAYSTGSSNYTLTATSKDSVFNGRTYKVFSNSNGANEYYCISGSDYYRYAFVNALNQSVDLLYLKDNAAVGDKWSDTKNITIQGVAVTAVIETKIAEKNISYSVNGKTYTNVIHIKVSPAFSVGSLSIVTTTNDVNYYFAKGVGLIYSNVNISVTQPFPFTVTGETKLLSYTIN